MQEHQHHCAPQLFSQNTNYHLTVVHTEQREVSGGAAWPLTALLSGVRPFHLTCGFCDWNRHCLQPAKQSTGKSLEELFPRTKAEYSQRSFKSCLNRKTLKTPWLPVLHRTICSHWPGITFPFPARDAFYCAAPYRSTPLDGSMQPAEPAEIGVLDDPSLFLLAEKGATGPGAHAASSYSSASQASSAKWNFLIESWNYNQNPSEHADPTAGQES